MNAQSMLILLIVAIGIAALGVVMYQQVLTETQRPISAPGPQATISIVEAGVHNITNNTAGHLRVAITTDKPINLSHTQITLRTPQETAYLSYREGDLVRDEATGYYTE